MYLLYLHRRKTDDIVFYVGIGNSKRPYIKNTRSSFWKNEVQKHNYTIEILTDNLNWENAQESEIRLIKLYGRRDLGLGTLVNLTDGGDGSPGVIQSEESKLKKSLALKGKNLGITRWNYGKNPYAKIHHYRSRKIINTKTGEIYPTVKIVLNMIDVPKTTFLRWLNYPEKNKTVFKYFE